MAIKLFDLSGEEISLDNTFANQLLAKFNSRLDPRVSACVHCNSCVVAFDPFERLLDLIRDESSDAGSISTIFDFLESAGSIHLYIWEENSCTHTLWLDPLFAEWSKATGEKRIRH